MDSISSDNSKPFHLQQLQRLAHFYVRLLYDLIAPETSNITTHKPKASFQLQANPKAQQTTHISPALIKKLRPNVINMPDI